MCLKYCSMYDKQCRPWSDAAFCGIRMQHLIWNYTVCKVLSVRILGLLYLIVMLWVLIRSMLTIHKNDKKLCEDTQEMPQSWSTVFPPHLKERWRKSNATSSTTWNPRSTNKKELQQLNWNPLGMISSKLYWGLKPVLLVQALFLGKTVQYHQLLLWLAL